MPDDTAAHYANEAAALIAAYQKAAPFHRPPTIAERLTCGCAMVTDAANRSPHPSTWWTATTAEEAEDVAGFLVSNLLHGARTPPGEIAQLAWSMFEGGRPARDFDDDATVDAMVALMEYAANFGADPREVLASGVEEHRERLLVCGAQVFGLP